MKAKKIGFLALILFLVGCQWDLNRENLNKIEVGMTKSEVREIMGQPYQREVEGQMEWWLYQTNVDPYGNMDNELTPIAFANGKLIGWGRNFYKSKTKRYDVKIDQTIKQD